MNRYKILTVVIVCVIFALPCFAGEKILNGSLISRPDNSFFRQFENIQGQADFEKLRKFSKKSLPYKLGTRVAHLEIFFSNVDYSYCTGFLVGKDLLLTNHHCLFDSNARAVEKINVYMDYWGDRNKGGISANVTKILQHNQSLDYALLKLSKPIGKKYGWLELDGGTANQIRNVQIIQHPRGRSKEIVRKNTAIKKVDSAVIHYSADTEGGSSGSPVFR